MTKTQESQRPSAPHKDRQDPQRLWKPGFSIQ